MKRKFVVVASLVIALLSSCKRESDKPMDKLFMDVHELGAGNLTFDAAMEAHKKDLAEGPQYGVKFIKFWVDEAKGKIFCLATAAKQEDIIAVHANAHGLLPKELHEVKGDIDLPELAGKPYLLDYHNIGAGNVTALAAAGAHKKDLEVQNKYGVNFINYWLDEKNGVIFCLAQGTDSTSLINTHKEAHGLLPNSVQIVKQGK